MPSHSDARNSENRKYLRRATKDRREQVLALLGDGKRRTCKQIAKALGVRYYVAFGVVRLLRTDGLIRRAYAKDADVWFRDVAPPPSLPLDGKPSDVPQGETKAPRPPLLKALADLNDLVAKLAAAYPELKSITLSGREPGPGEPEGDWVQALDYRAETRGTLTIPPSTS